ncbi:MAG: rhodanese-like domain-containing protein [Oceanicoccus sp.]
MLQSIPELIQAIRADLRCISAEQARTELASGKGVFIDVRETEEVNAKPSKAAIHIPRGILEMKMAMQFPDPKQPIYLHCQTGGRATLAAEQLKRLGYTNVSVVTCPIDDICKLETV